MINWDEVLARWIQDGKPVYIKPDNSKRDNAVLHVTDVGDCPRKVAYKLLGHQEVRPPQDYIMLDAGTDRHNKMYNALAHAKYDFECEVPAPMPAGWSGTCDLLIADTTDCDLKDFKTVRAAAFKREASYPEWPKPSHCQQVHIYKWAFNQDTKRVKALSIVYMDRDGSNQSQEKAVLTEAPDVPALMAEYEAVRDALPYMPDPLKRLGLAWIDRRPLKNQKDANGRTYERDKRFSADLYDASDWRCRYCYMKDCTMTGAKSLMIAQRRAKGLTLTQYGRSRAAEVYNFLDKEGINDKIRVED